MHRISTVFRRLLQDLDLAFFYAFLLSLPFGWRKVISANWFQASGNFNEYLDISVYVSELLLLICYIILLCNEIARLSIVLFFRQYKLKNVFHVEHRILLLTFLFAGLCIVSAIWSYSAIFTLSSSAHLIPLVGLVPYFMYRIVPRGTKVIREIVFVLITASILQAIIAGGQVYRGSSLGLQFLNEPIINIQNINVAKVDLGSVLLLRGYGTFSHPNIAGAFFLLTVAIVLYAKTFIKFHVEHYFFLVAKLSLLCGIVLTFSKSAILGAILLLILNSSTWNIWRRYALATGVLIFAIAVAFFIPGFRESQSLSDRIYLINDQLTIVTLVGSGYATSVATHLDLHNHTNFWENEPIHSVWLLILSELGIIGLLIFALIFIALHYVPRGTIPLHTPLVFVLFLASLADHYLWDIYQGQAILWLGIALSAHILTKE